MVITFRLVCVYSILCNRLLFFSQTFFKRVQIYASKCFRFWYGRHRTGKTRGEISERVQHILYTSPRGTRVVHTKRTVLARRGRSRCIVGGHGSRKSTPWSCIKTIISIFNIIIIIIIIILS